MQRSPSLRASMRLSSMARAFKITEHPAEKCLQRTREWAGRRVCSDGSTMHRLDPATAAAVRHRQLMCSVLHVGAPSCQRRPLPAPACTL